ncbi:DsrE family protein [Ectothiorhodospiraceae bacterium 2226]|nr:DsrE family protein [Ectothiorhodospiraceae bacterium 2226]
MQRLTRYTFVLLMLWFAAAAAQGASINDAAALQDLKVGKGVFLVDIGEPQKLAFYLEVIRGTHANMRDQGVEPDFVLVYIGPSVPYLTTEPTDEVAFDHANALQAIAEHVAALDELGVRQEICDVATRAFGVDNETVLPALKVVRDGFISLVGYQAQGYHLVPVF